MLKFKGSKVVMEMDDDGKVKVIEGVLKEPESPETDENKKDGDGE